VRLHDLKGICPELVIAFESCIKADSPRRFYFGHLHNEVFIEIVLKTDQESIITDGVHFFSGNFLFGYRSRECES
jgi:hypothetical protein